MGPVGASGFDIVLRDETRHGSERVGEVRGLSDPAGILPGERDADVERLHFPAGVKPPPLQAILFGVRETPRGPIEVQDDQAKTALGLAPDRPVQSIWSGLRSRRVLAPALAVLATSVPGAGVISQLEPLLVHNGVAFPALLISLFAVAVLVGRIGIGWLFDRRDANYVTGVFTVVGAAGCLMLMSGVPPGW